MGTDISGICGRESPHNAVIYISTNHMNSEEVIKAKSAQKIQSKWKKLKHLKLIRIKHLFDIKQKLDEISGYKIVSIELMRNKLSPSVVELEKKISPFNKEPEIRLFDLCFERDPIELNDCAIYHGQWNEKGQKHGYGVLVRNDGSKYEGFFNHDNLNGRGRYIESQGNFYYEGKSVI